MLAIRINLYLIMACFLAASNGKQGWQQTMMDLTEAGYMSDCVIFPSFDVSDEKGMDPEAIYSEPENAKMVDLLLNDGGDNHHDGASLLSDLSDIYQQIEYDSGEIERLTLKSNYTLKDLLTSIKTSSMAMAKMSGVLAVRDLALNPSVQDSGRAGGWAGEKLGSVVAELMADTIKNHITAFEAKQDVKNNVTIAQKITNSSFSATTMERPSDSKEETKRTSSMSTTKPESDKTTSTRKESTKRRRRRQTQFLDIRDYLKDMEASQVNGAIYNFDFMPYRNSLEAQALSLLDDESIYDLDVSSRSLANLVHKGHASSHGNRFGRDTTNQENNSEDLKISTTTTPKRRARKKGRMKAIKHEEQANIRTAPPDDGADGASRANPLPSYSSTIPKPKTLSEASTTRSPSTNSTTGEATNIVGTTSDNSPVEAIVDRAKRVFTVASVAGYVHGHKLAMLKLIQARSLKNNNKYISASELGFKNGLERGWSIGMRKSLGISGDVWSKLKNVYNRSSVFNEGRRDPYDSGADIGFMVGSVVGYNTARKLDPTLDGSGGTLEKVLSAGKSKYSSEYLQKLASRRAAYEAGSQAAFEAALKVGFLTGAKLGPKAGLFYTQRSGARSGAKIGAILGAEAGLKASGDTTARVALHGHSHLMSMVLPQVTGLGNNIALTCGRDSGRVIGALVGALSAAEGFRAFIDNSGSIEAIPTEYKRFKTGAEQGYKLGHTTGISIKINRNSPYYIDPLKNINLNSIEIVDDLPKLTRVMLNKMKALNNMTIEKKDNEINGDIKDERSGKSFKVELKLSAHPGHRKSGNIYFGIVGKMDNGGNDDPYLDHIHGFLTGTASEDNISLEDSKLDREEKAQQVLYEEAKKGIMPSSRDNLKIITAIIGNGVDEVQANSANSAPRHYVGSIFDNESPPNETLSGIDTHSSITTVSPGTKQNAMNDKTIERKVVATRPESKNKKRKKSNGTSTTIKP